MLAWMGTIDNASSNVVVIKEMSKQLSNWGTNIMGDWHLHVRCITHILNLIVQNGLKKIGKSIKRVRQVVKYIKQSPARIRKFKECCESQQWKKGREKGREYFSQAQLPMLFLSPTS